jgi:hypothetical protein
MVSNVPLDHYTLVLEAVSSNGLQQVRAIATNTATKSTVEAQLSVGQTRALLAHTYGGEQSIIENHIEHLDAGHTLAILANSKDFCVFNPQELAQFGFNPKDL